VSYVIYYLVSKLTHSEIIVAKRVYIFQNQDVLLWSSTSWLA